MKPSLSLLFLLAIALPAAAQGDAAAERGLQARVDAYLSRARDLSALQLRRGKAGDELLAAEREGRALRLRQLARGAEIPVLLAPADGDQPAGSAKKKPGTDAADKSAAEPGGTLPTTTVRAATLTQHTLEETVPSVNVVSRKEMDEKVPQGIAEALHWQPGIWHTQSSGATLGTPVIRGYQGNQVLFLLDGIRLTHERTPTGPGPDWEDFDTDLIDHIEVLRTPDSVLYGTGAIGGVTAVYTKFPAPYAEKGYVYGGHTRYTVSTGGLDFWRMRASGYASTQDWRFAAGASILRSEDIDTPTRTLVPTAFDMYGADFRVEHRIDSDNTVGGAFYIMKKRWDGNWLFPMRPRDQRLGREIWMANWQNTAVNPAYDDLEVRVGVVHNSQLYKRTDILDRNAYDIYTIQATAIAHKEITGGHTLTYGVDTHTGIDDIRRRRSTGLVREVPKGHITYVGGLVQDEWKVNTRVRVVAGVRLDGVFAKTSPDAATTPPILDPSLLRIDQSDLAFTGKIGVLYKATNRVSFTANYSRGYRHPSLTDLAGLLQAPDEIDVGNPNVKPEYSNTFEIGVHYNSPKVRANLVGYYTQNPNAIVRTYGTVNGQSYYDLNGNGMEDSDEDFVLTMNAGRYSFWGIEADAEADVCRYATVFGNLTTWRGSFNPQPTEPTGIPNNLTLGVRLHDEKTFFVEFAGHFVARFDQIAQDFYNAEDFFKVDPQDPASPTIRNDHSIPGYSLFDIRAGVRLSEKVDLTMGITNLFNKDYRNFGDRHNAPARTFYLSLGVDF